MHLSLEHAGDREHVGLGEVHDVDVVAQAGAVLGGIVVAEDAEAGALADGGLGDERDQVVRDAARELADEGARVRADGVEIAEEDALDCTAVGFHRVAEDVLAHGLGVAVGRRGGLAGRLLRDGNDLRLAVNRGRGREQHVAAAFLLRRFQHVQETQEVVLIVHHRLLHGLAHGLEGREMDDRVDGIVREDLLHRGRVAEVHLHERKFPFENLLHTLEAGAVAVGEIVGHDHVVARLDQFHGHVAPDEPRAAGYKHCFLHRFSVLDHTKIVKNLIFAVCEKDGLWAR